MLLSITAPAILRAAESQEPVTEKTAAETTINAPDKALPQELSDDFLAEVADGSKPAADGAIAEEESGDTMDQTLRTHTRPPP